MNYIKHLAGFFDRVAADERLNPSHISMYLSLFQFWNANRFQNPISIARSEVMRISKISATATYHKCLNELHEFGYLRYVPSFNPIRGSHVYMFNLQSGNRTKKQSGTEQVLVSSHAKKRRGTEQVLAPYINSININKQENIINGQQQKEILEGLHNNHQVKTDLCPPQEETCGSPVPERGRSSSLNPNETEQTDLCPPQEGACSGPARERGRSNEIVGPNELESANAHSDIDVPAAPKPRPRKNIPQSLEEAIAYFASRSYPAKDAERFYNHFCSNGWLVGGKAPMKDWKAAARNWMLNTKNYNNEPKQSLQPGNLHTTTDKNYSEPL